MALLTMTVIREDGTREKVTAGPKQQVAFERARKKGMGAAFAGDGLFMEDVLFLAWLADKDATAKAGGTVPLFDVWLDTVADVDMSGGDDGAAPS